MKVKIRKSSIHGKGIFTVKKIKKDETVFRLIGNKLVIKHKPGCNCQICRMCIEVGKNLWFYPKSFGRYLNHSCDCSCGIKRGYVVALKDLDIGDEITIDYSTTTADRNWTQKCSCGNKNCRKMIQSVQFMPKKMFNKYQNYMPAYVRNNYKS
jgi:uncharacterized protein